MGKVDKAVLDIARNPLVAAVPNIQIEVEDFSVGVVKEINTVNDGKNINLRNTTRRSEVSTTKGWEIGLNLGMGVGQEGGTKASGSLGLNWGYNNSTTTVNSMEEVDGHQTERGWAKSIGLNTGSTAYAYGAVRYNNVGTAPAYKVVPTVTIGLPITKNNPKVHDTIGTLTGKVNEGHIAESLPPFGSYPGKDSLPVFFSDFSNYRAGSISLLQSQFERFEQDKQLQIDLNQFSGQVTVSNKSPESGNDWTHYITQVEQETARILFEMPTRKVAGVNMPERKNPSVEILERRVVGTSDRVEAANRPSVSVSEALTLASDLQITETGYKYGDFTFNDLTIAFDEASSRSVSAEVKNGTYKTFADIKLKAGAILKVVPKGWVKSEKITYYYGEDGKLATGFQKIKDPSTSVEKVYYFDKDGRLVADKRGWQGIDRKTVYIGKKDDGTGLAEGELAKGFRKIDGKTHYFSDDGSAWAANSWLPDYDQAGQPNTWYMLEKGEVVSGWKELDGKWYYFDPNKGCRVSTGWQTINGKKYYLGKSGDGSNLAFTGKALAEGERARGWFHVGKDKYLAKKDGSLELDTYDWDPSRYFFDKTTGKCLFETEKIGNKVYGYDSSYGISYIKTSIHGFYDHNGKPYYFNNDGILEERTFIDWQKIDGKWYYFG
ncbi:hypothetical protein ACIQ48_30255, partial [Bacillus mycoides]